MRAIKARSGLDKRVHDLLCAHHVRHKTYPMGTHGPDVYITDRNLYVYLHGCFWHGCEAHCKVPKTNSAFWAQKIYRNMERDHRLFPGSIIVWEHEVEAGHFDGLF